ncbi:MAG: ABC transporter substrate-binding protein, partial [Alphaproteobacteria bacterium]|nr:ABC transporter substrate-binding protein [Alphaproteobacteria bacterium]
KANGLDLDKITVLKVDPNTMFGLMTTGQCDATISWVTNKASAERVLKQTGKELEIIPWSNYGLDGYGLAVFAPVKVIKDKPELVARFVRAYTKAIMFGVTNPKKAAEDNHAMLSDLSVDEIDAEHSNAIPLIKNEISAKYGQWNFDPDWVKKTWEWVAKAQNYPIDKIDPQSAVDGSFVPKS